MPILNNPWEFEARKKQVDPEDMEDFKKNVDLLYQIRTKMIAYVRSYHNYLSRSRVRKWGTEHIIAYLHPGDRKDFEADYAAVQKRIYNLLG